MTAENPRVCRQRIKPPFEGLVSIYTKPEEECGQPVMFIVHWPGQDVQCCSEHAAGWANVAQAMGFKLSIDVIGTNPPITIWTPGPATCGVCKKEARELVTFPDNRRVPMCLDCGGDAIGKGDAIRIEPL